ncbi:riboflavin synthase domain-like protein [Armillaria mellea]|nr:riboflavin synthase domain-like protein [Armillaria mellea]
MGEYEKPLILYATESGNAQETADNIARHCRRIHLRCRIQDVETYLPDDLINECLIIFVIATTGSGVEPRSMTSLWDMLLRSDLPADLFEDMHFAVFGLGDSAYERFCWPAKKLSRRMKGLGATEIYERGEGDDQHMLGTDGTLVPWMEGLLGVLSQLFPLAEGTSRLPLDTVPPPRMAMIKSSEEESMDPLVQDAVYHHATLKCNRRITAEDWYQDVRHFQFSFEEDIQYNPGDVAVIHPLQPYDDVEEFLSSMGWGNIADEVYTLEHVEKDQTMPKHIPRCASLRTVFTRYLDFKAVPRRTFFQYLRYFNTDKQESEKLDEFLSVDTADELYDYCQRVRRTIQEVLTEFRGSKIPLPYIFDIFPPLRPREFSIASSVKMHPREIQLCIAIVKYRTRLKIPRRGICTSYLSALQPGPGTGVAPVRSLIEERIFTGTNHNTLYFGCRSALKDQHYGQEWKAYAKENKLVYRVAYSRDGPEGVKRTYVQDLIEADGERVWELISQGAWVYISGSSNKMPAAVRDALRHSVVNHGGLSTDEAGEYVKKMELEGKLMEECWS